MWLLIQCLAMGFGILAGASFVDIGHLPETFVLLTIPIGAISMAWFINPLEKFAKQRGVSSTRILAVGLELTTLTALLLKALGDDNEQTFLFTGLVFPGALIMAIDLRWLIGIPIMALVATGAVTAIDGIHALKNGLPDILNFAILLGFYFPVSDMVRYRSKFLD